MYLKKIEYCNVGPLKNVEIVPSFNKVGNPKPLIIVGENGSGKTTFLSNIIDSFYEIAGEAFSNVKKSDDDTNMRMQYYKTMSNYQINVGEKYLYSHILFDNKGDELEYIFKSGDLDVKEFKSKCDVKNKDRINWDVSDNYKNTFTFKNEDIEKIFTSDVICCFNPSRYEKPVWVGNKYNEVSNNEHIIISDHWKGKLRNPISADAVTESVIQWLLDVIVDSRPDVIADGSSISLDGVNIGDMPLLSRARDNIEKIMSSILGEDVRFRLNYRNRGADRFRIVRKRNNETIVPTLNALSTGQLALFNMFATIVKYGDSNDIDNSHKLEDITGIVIIDEAELHLHSILQADVFPKILKLFPKIQFIITTHAPLVVLGLDKEFGEDGLDMYELPDAIKINSERFSEFNCAYSYYKKTKKYEDEMNKLISGNDKTIVITEGSTDWKHLKAAYNKLKRIEGYSELFDNLDFSFLEYEPEESDAYSDIKINMGSSKLLSMCKNAVSIPHNNKIIFICDRDVPNVLNEFSEEGENYKKWGNGVYSFAIPLPDFRKNTPEISIEHLYTDDEIKTEFVIDGIPRRLFIGNEFDKRGLDCNNNRHCTKLNSCGPDKIEIIGGSDKEKVTGINEDGEVNYCLSKMKFAENILNEVQGFSNFNFTEFIPIFRIIKQICEDE